MPNCARPGGGQRDTFTALLKLCRAAASSAEDGERKSEFRMGRLPSAFAPYAQVPTMCRCRKTDCAGPYGVRFSRPVRPEHSFGV